MPKFAAVLRAVNLGPHNKVAMAAPRGLTESPAFASLACKRIEALS